MGIIPGPNEPKLHINSFLKPVVADLMKLWEGVVMQKDDSTSVIVRAALLSVACDIPAARKVSGFVGPQATKGCSKCLLSFSVINFGDKPDYSNFDLSKWNPRDDSDHRRIAEEYLNCKTAQSRKDLERKHGIRYSILIELPYFSPSRMTIIDPMHNLLLGTSKYIMNVWKELGFLDTKSFEEIQALVVSRFICSS